MRVAVRQSHDDVVEGRTPAEQVVDAGLRRETERGGNALAVATPINQHAPAPRCRQCGGEVAGFAGAVDAVADEEGAIAAALRGKRRDVACSVTGR